MNISEFKQAVHELSQASLSQPDVEVFALMTELKAALQDLSDDAPVYPELMIEIRHVFSQFWEWITKNLPFDRWQQDDMVTPWLTLQAKLVQADLLITDYHHPILYRALSEQFSALNPESFEVEELLLLFTRCAQLIGYAETIEPFYPLSRLKSSLVNLERYRSRQQLDLFKTQVSLFLAAFYLIHHYCHAEQLLMLQHLLNYRFSTTTLEKDSELSIIVSLCQEIPAWQAFFAINHHCWDAKIFKQEECLKNLSTLMPTTRSACFKAVHQKRWIFAFIHQTRQLKTLEGDELFNYTVQLLSDDFATLKDPSYSAALAFAAKVRKQTAFLLEKEVSLIQDALYTFCLHIYETERRTNKRHSSFLFSGKTKCNAAEKKRRALAGFPIKYGLFEVLALKQGRLGALVNMFEQG